VASAPRATLTPFWASDNGATRVDLYHAHVLDVLRALPARSVHTVITSPPYFQQRDYGLPPQIWGGDPACRHVWSIAHGYSTLTPSSRAGAKRSAPGRANAARLQRARHWRSETCERCGGWRGCLGLEPTSDLFIAHLALVFREIRRVLHPSGTVWINISDTYDKKHLLNIPGRLIDALKHDGFIYRAELVWAKAVSLCPTYSGSARSRGLTDRPTPSHELVLLFSLRPRYYYDVDAVREPHNDLTNLGGFHGRGGVNAAAYEARKWTDRSDGVGRPPITMRTRAYHPLGRPLRSVWTVNPQPNTAGLHLATFPEDLVRPMVLAGTSARGCCPTCGAPWRRDVSPTYVKSPRHGARSVVGRHVATGQNGFDGTASPRRAKVVTTTGWRPTCACDGNSAVPCTVLDPFSGSGTTLLVAQRLGRNTVGIELSDAYCAAAQERIGAEHSQMRLLTCPAVTDAPDHTDRHDQRSQLTLLPDP